MFSSVLHLYLPDARRRPPFNNDSCDNQNCLQTLPVPLKQNHPLKEQTNDLPLSKRFKNLPDSKNEIKRQQHDERKKNGTIDYNG